MRIFSKLRKSTTVDFKWLDFIYIYFLASALIYFENFSSIVCVLSCCQVSPEHISLSINILTWLYQTGQQQCSNKTKQKTPGPNMKIRGCGTSLSLHLVSFISLVAVFSVGPLSLIYIWKCTAFCIEIKVISSVTQLNCNVHHFYLDIISFFSSLILHNVFSLLL